VCQGCGFSLDANNAIAVLEARLARKANRVLVYLYLISLPGVASGIVFFGEMLGFEKLVGGAVTLLGVYLARRQ
jgi:drug/metabolite transporter (DMT)-like permease